MRTARLRKKAVRAGRLRVDLPSGQALEDWGTAAAACRELLELLFLGARKTTSVDGVVTYRFTPNV